VSEAVVDLGTGVGAARLGTFPPDRWNFDTRTKIDSGAKPVLLAAPLFCDGPHLPFFFNAALTRLPA
jgi:hypothetical protein